MQPSPLTPEDLRRVRRFRALLTFSGLFNITLAAPLMVPGLSRDYLAFLSRLNTWLSLGGREVVAPDGVGALLANTAGIDLVLIGVLVLYAARAPLSRWFIPAANAVGRLLFAGVVVYSVVVSDLARIVLVIGAIDVVLAVAFVVSLFGLRAALARPG